MTNFELRMDQFFLDGENRMSKEKTYKTLNELTDSQLLYDKEPPPLGRYLILTVAVALTVALIWSTTAMKPYVVIGNGSVVSDSKNYIMSSYAGEITEALVKEGDYVREGDVLFRLSSTELELQEKQLTDLIKLDRQKIRQYERLESSVKIGKNLFDENREEDKPYYYQYEAYLSQISQNKVDTGVYKSYDYSDAQIEATVRNNEAVIAEIYYSTLKSVSDSIEALRTETASYEIQLESVKSGKSDYPVQANTSGFVHMDTEYKKGMVIPAASAIGSIVRENDRYTAQVYVSASEMPLIHVGDPAEVAVSGLSQNIYGTVSGTVSYISSEASSSGSNTGGYFLVKIPLQSSYLVSNKGNKVNISNGMTVEARIQYDELTYFDYVLDYLGMLVR